MRIIYISASKTLRKSNCTLQTKPMFSRIIQTPGRRVYSLNFTKVNVSQYKQSEGIFHFVNEIPPMTITIVLCESKRVKKTTWRLLYESSKQSRIKLFHLCMNSLIIKLKVNICTRSFYIIFNAI